MACLYFSVYSSKTVHCSFYSIHYHSLLQLGFGIFSNLLAKNHKWEKLLTFAIRIFSKRKKMSSKLEHREISHFRDYRHLCFNPNSNTSDLESGSDDFTTTWQRFWGDYGGSRRRRRNSGPGCWQRRRSDLKIGLLTVNRDKLIAGPWLRNDAQVWKINIFFFTARSKNDFL